METETLVLKVKDLAKSLPADHQALVTKLNDNSSRYKELLMEENTIKEVSEAMRLLQEKVSKSTISFVENFLTQGIQSVYHDREFKIVLVIGDRGQRKTLSIRVQELIDGVVIESDITNGSGGGIQVVVSFLLQVLTILSRNLTRVIFLDEALSAVSSEYLDGLFELIGSLKTEFDFSFLMITQDPRFLQYSDVTYKVRNGVYTKA